MPAHSFPEPRGTLRCAGVLPTQLLSGLPVLWLVASCRVDPAGGRPHCRMLRPAVQILGLQENFEAGHVCWDDNDLIDGRPTGAVRVSFGLSSTAGDAAAVLDFVRLNFLQSRGPLAPLQRGLQDQTQAGAAADRAEKPRLAGIWVYPVKSCAGCSQVTMPVSEAQAFPVNQHYNERAYSDANRSKTLDLRCPSLPLANSEQI